MVGADSRKDIALLKINPENKTVEALLLGDSTGLQVGQSVLAIGNPFGCSGDWARNRRSEMENGIAD